MELGHVIRETNKVEIHRASKQAREPEKSFQFGV